MADVDISTLTDDQKKAVREGYVPVDRLNEATGKLKDDNAKLQQQIASLTATVEAIQTTKQTDDKKPTIYTRAQLQAYVDDEKITQQEADDYYDQQQEYLRAQEREEMRQEMRQEMQQGQALSTLKDKISQYSDLLPDVVKSGSEDRTKVDNEYQRLANIMGTPKKDSVEDFKMQVAALESVFGSVDDVRARIRSASNSNDRDTMQDTLGSGDDNTGKGTGKDGVPKGLSPKQKAYYEEKISKGIYKDWDAVKAELNWERGKK